MHHAEGAMKRAEGVQRDADYLLDCNWFEYYWRIVSFNRYQEWVKEQSKKK
jgi:hypothetical protein